MTRTVIGPPPSFPATTGIQPSFSIPRAGVSRKCNLVTDIVARRSDNGSPPADPAIAHRLVPLVLDATRICRRDGPWRTRTYGRRCHDLLRRHRAALPGRRAAIRRVLPPARRQPRGAACDGRPDRHAAPIFPGPSVAVALRLAGAPACRGGSPRGRGADVARGRRALARAAASRQ